jgi:hypothetical protein
MTVTDPHSSIATDTKCRTPGVAGAVSLPPLLRFAVSARRAFMLSQVFRPRTHHKRLSISTGMLEIV